MLLRIILYIVIGLPVLFIILHTTVRIIRYFNKFPMPEFAANIIDNPLRRKIQPPQEMPKRHGITPGMRVLEIGPGNGTYTIAAANALGLNGHLTTIDIEPKMIERVKQRIIAKGIQNIDARVANVFELPYEMNTFDLIYSITVIGEIPTPERSLLEFYRVLKPEGILAFSEILMDPDYPLATTLISLAQGAGFQLKDRLGNFFSYTLVFKKHAV